MRLTCSERRERETLFKRETLKDRLCLELRGRNLLRLKVCLLPLPLLAAVFFLLAFLLMAAVAFFPPWLLLMAAVSLSRSPTLISPPGRGEQGHASYANIRETLRAGN